MEIDWDFVIKAWAVVGPLLTGAAGAMWARHVQKQDRVYEQSQRETARKNAIDDAQKEWARNTSDARRKELHALLSEFLAAAADFADDAILKFGSDDPKLALSLGKERGVMNRAALTAVLVSPASLAKKIAALSNSAVDILGVLIKNDQKELNDAVAKYSKCKEELIHEARQVLGSKTEA